MKDADIERLYVAYSKLIYGYLLKCTGDESLSEELTQETFYQAMILWSDSKGSYGPVGGMGENELLQGKREIDERGE